MAYQGEDIPLTIRTIDMDLNFKILVYPCGGEDNAYEIDKSDCKAEEEGIYSAVIPHDVTSRMKVSEYTIEVVIISSDGSTRRAYMRRQAFPLLSAASRNLE